MDHFDAEGSANSNKKLFFRLFSNQFYWARPLALRRSAIIIGSKPPSLPLPFLQNHNRASQWFLWPDQISSRLRTAGSFHIGHPGELSVTATLGWSSTCALRYKKVSQLCESPELGRILWPNLHCTVKSTAAALIFNYSSLYLKQFGKKKVYCNLLCFVIRASD